MNISLRFLALSCCLASVFLYADEPARVPALVNQGEVGALPPDPALRVGRLANGVRYAVQANSLPKGRASLRLLVDAGSLQETEEQRGLAHYLEHMAFNGSTRFAPGTLDAFFQNMGMSVGGDANAITSRDRTQYMLELADATEPTLTAGLSVLADFAGGLLLLPEQVDKERGIVLSEMRARDGVDARITRAREQFLFAGTLIPERAPIGLAEVVQQANRERLADFYNTWYRPENVVIVAVGDFAPEVAEALVRGAFDGLVARAPARPKPDLGRVDLAPGLRVAIHDEPAAANISVSLSVLSAVEERAKPTTLTDGVARELALNMVNRRLQSLAAKPDAPFAGASVSAEDGFGLFTGLSLGLTVRADAWQAALSLGDRTVRQAFEHGFTTAELQSEVAAKRRRLQQAVDNTAVRRSAARADDWAEALRARRLPRDPALDQSLFEPVLAALTPEACAEALRLAWAGGARRLFVSGKLGKETEQLSAAASAAYEQSLAQPVEPWPVETKPTWAYTDFGARGEVVRRERVEDLDLTLVAFANGVRLNLKRTTFEPGRIAVGVRVGRGALSAPLQPQGVVRVTDAVLGAGGLGRHTPDELRSIFEFREVAARFRITNDAFLLSAGTTGRDLLLELQLIAAKLTDPGYETTTWSSTRAKLAAAQSAANVSATENHAGAIRLLVAGGDTRFAPPKDGGQAMPTLTQVRTWLEPEFMHGPIEIAMVGDLDIDAAIDAVAATLGALPRRDSTSTRSEWPDLRFPETPFVYRGSVVSDVANAQVTLFWPSTDGIEPGRMRRLRMLGEILGERIRLKIREEMGDTYTPSVSSVSSDVFPGYGYFTASINAAPERAEQVTDAAISVADDLARNGITPEEFHRAHQPILTAIRQSERNNGYWLNAVLARAQSMPSSLDECRSRSVDIAAMTKAELDELASRYLRADRASRAVLVAEPAKK